MIEKERTKVVVDETTIYEIDLDCYECRKTEKKEPRIDSRVQAKQGSNSYRRVK